VILELVQEHAANEVTNFVQDPQLLLEPETTIRIMCWRDHFEIFGTGCDFIASCWRIPREASSVPD